MMNPENVIRLEIDTGRATLVLDGYVRALRGAQGDALPVLQAEAQPAVDAVMRARNLMTVRALPCERD
ncbi:hypothetical protein [Paraburkholderia sp. 35.1]|uniref:hypothetical protein n=1 Tax=Paraburkholderia sp. 35.1 TaxID=2991058 RepID=UPI003D23DEE8